MTVTLVLLVLLLYCCHDDDEKEDDDGDNEGSSPRCEHGKACVKLTARTGDNAGREFYKCSLPRDGSDQCSFFQWVDGEASKI